MNPVESQKSIRERVRIQWRAFVMSLPGGVLWLRIQARLLKWREQDCGPHKLQFPEPE